MGNGQPISLEGYRYPLPPPAEEQPSEREMALELALKQDALFSTWQPFFWLADVTQMMAGTAFPNDAVDEEGRLKKTGQAIERNKSNLVNLKTPRFGIAMIIYGDQWIQELFQ